EVDGEAVGERQHHAGAQVWLDRLTVEASLADVGRQHDDDGGLLDRLRHVLDPQPRALGFRTGLAAPVEPHTPGDPAVFPCLGMRVTLRAIAEDGDLLPQAVWAVAVVVHLHGHVAHASNKKAGAPARGRGLTSRRGCFSRPILWLPYLAW